MTKPATFESALKMLDDAIEDQLLPSLGELVLDEARFFKGLLAKELSKSVQELAQGGRELTGLANDVGSVGRGHLSQLVGRIDHDFRENRMLYLGAAAAAAIAVGFLLSQRPSKGARK